MIVIGGGAIFNPIKRFGTTVQYVIYTYIYIFHLSINYHTNP